MRRAPHREWRHRAAFTLMELMTVILIIAILSAMIIPAFGYMRARAERTKCVQNLKSLYVGAQLHIQEFGYWPQVDGALLNKPAFADAWAQALERYSISRENWVCPTVQRLLRDPDLSIAKNHRVDYFGTPFSKEAGMPYRWPTQPWFIEKGDVHGDGQLMIFTNGDVKPLHDVLRDTQVQQLEW